MPKKKKKDTTLVSKFIVRRMFLAISLSLIFGIISAYLSWKADPFLQLDHNYWRWPVMASIVFNRFLIGFVLIFVWFVKVHPVFNIRMYPVIRWALIWALISIDMTFSSYIMWYSRAAFLAWFTLSTWAIYWIIIDYLATKFWAEWAKLYASDED